MSKQVSFFVTLFATVALLGTIPSSAAHSEETLIEWQKTYNELTNSSDPLAPKLLFWLKVTETNQPISTEDLIHFTLENSGWPKLYLFRDRLEQNVGTSSFPHTSQLAAWFDQNPPKSYDGIRAYMQALLSLGYNDKAKAALKRFWTNAELNRKETPALAKEYKRFFSPTAHIDRLDNLLWNLRYQEAEYMLPFVDVDHQKLARAEIAIGRMSSKAPKFIHAVPASLQNESSFLFSRLKWRRQMNKDEDALNILRHVPKNPSHPELWWRERSILARRAIEKRNYSSAYKILLDHGMTSGPDYAQAEWMLGWISLRFLYRPEIAYRHFDNFYQTVNSAVSRSRAYYWLARTTEVMKQNGAARNWNELCAQLPSTFYGQLCYERIYGAMNASQFVDDQASPELTRAFEEKEQVHAIRLLAKMDLLKYTDPFFIKLLDKAKDRPDFVLIAKLAREIGRHYFSVEANKQLQQKLGDFMFTEGYPVLPSLPIDKPEKALIHAIVHRESMFNTMAASPAGARGLMQLMPATARHISKTIGKKYTADKLMDNPQYNVELGATYLQHLIDGYSGFYPLAIAAYNAGPTNVNQWIREFGDPRSGKIDITDWIELIPINETRNYVQRVMESYYLYKLKFSEKPRTVLSFARG